MNERLHQELRVMQSEIAEKHNKRPGLIYLFESNNSIKIGYTSSLTALARRKTNLQVGNPYPLKLIRLIDPGSKWQEEWLHRKFEALKTRGPKGEWFNFTEEMLNIWPPNPWMNFAKYVYRRCNEEVQEITNANL